MSAKSLISYSIVLATCWVVGHSDSDSVVEKPNAKTPFQVERTPNDAIHIDPNVTAVQCLVDEPCRNCPIHGVDCLDQCCGPELRWHQNRPLPWQIFAHGEYTGVARTPHVPEYRLRPDDQITFVYRLTREILSQPYKLNPGDRIRVESLSDKDLDRELIVQPDGSITVRLLGQIQAAGRTVTDLQKDLEKRYVEFYQNPAITVTPVVVETKLDDLRNTVDSRQGVGGQSVATTVSPDGTVQLPALSSVYVQGLTLDEAKMEVDARYKSVVGGIEVTPILTQRAPRFIYVLGEVRQPGRFELVGPTTAMQAIALAQGWQIGSNLREIIVFRRTENWRLMATRLDLRGGLYGKRPVPSDEIWLRDSDIVLVPKSPMQRSADFIQLVFAQGINEILPLLTGLDLLEATF